MLAFTFPGQGSQRPGMGRPWASEESWELVGEASEIAERDLERLLLDADADELKDTRNAQLCTFVSSLVVLDAIERTGLDAMFCAGHSLGEYTALVATGALSFDEGVQLVFERAEAMHAAGQDQPGTMAAVLGLDDDDVEIACRRADSDVWVANFNAPGQVVIAGSPGRGGVCRREREGARSEEGAPAPGERRVPHSVHGAGARSVAQGDREREATRHRRAGHLERRRARARPGGRLGEPALGAALQPGALAPVPARPRRCRRDHARRVRAGRCVDRHGEAHGAQRPALSVSTPDEVDRLLETIAGTSTTPHLTGHEGEHLFATERLVVSPAAGVFTPDPSIAPGHVIQAGTVVGRVGDHEVRSPFGGSVMGLIAVDGERVTVSQPIAWLRTA